ncbi:hypothetical protein [Robiginitalea sp. SC105]|uniref:hypothetical protein n=1 Tax=Robiginitalea sp. SC105 TaxID=2762332 RepID=UPI00163B39B0|nr:hypothetical protein [Robiginitalea sp. SC105]MBC2839854.1 hypothetical protein [Robiginitalea sp. SC105]
METNVLLKWVLVNAAGFGLGFVLWLQLDFTLKYGFDFEKHWAPEQTWDFTVWMYIRRLIVSIVFGAFIGYLQSIVLKSININNRLGPFSWVLVTAIGIGLMVIIIDWPLRLMGYGNLPGPLDPIIVTVGSGTFAGIAQYFFLTKKGIKTNRWLLLWIIGLFLSLIPTALFFMFIGDKLDLSWPMEIFISGFIVGGVAAWVSGKAFLTVLSRTKLP